MYCGRVFALQECRDVLYTMGVRVRAFVLCLQRDSTPWMWLPSGFTRRSLKLHWSERKTSQSIRCHAEADCSRKEALTHLAVSRADPVVLGFVFRVPA